MSAPRLVHVRRVVLALAALALGLGILAPPVDAHRSRPPRPGPSEAVVLDEGLNSPKGLDSFFGLPILGQGAFGPPGPLLLHVPGFLWFDGVTLEVSEPIGLVDVALAPDLHVWGLGSDQTLYRKSLSGGFVPVANIAAYQATDPDPANTEGEPTESNPYAVAALPTGDALVADAAGNDLLRVTPSGDITTVARFGPELIPTDHVGDPTLPPEIPAEAVPTSIAVTHHGVLIGELKGFPFRPGTSRIWKVDPFGADAECGLDDVPSPARHGGPSGGCTVVHDGLTAIQDLAYDGWRGKLYVYELAAEGTLAFEEGFATGQFPAAVLLELDRHGRQRELAAGQLSQPGGVEVSAFGTLYATDGMFTGGRLLRIRR